MNIINMKTKLIKHYVTNNFEILLKLMHLTTVKNDCVK